MALLGARLTGVESKLDALLDEMRKVSDCYHALDKTAVQHEAAICTNKAEIDRLRASSNRWDAIIAVVMMILGALGLTKS